MWFMNNKQSVFRRKMFLFFNTILLLSISFLGASARFETKINKLVQDSVEIIVSHEVAELMKSSGYEMISGALYIRGKTFQFHYGKLSNGKKPDTNTLFEIGSVTKTYTGLLLSQAVYDKKVNLDEDIRTYIEGSYPNLIMSNGEPITLRHLITHTSGLPMNINCIGFGPKIEEQLSCFKSFSSKSFFQALKEIKLKDNSHDQYNYSNAGVQLVGYILENTYKLPYKALLEKYIFSRSGEQETYFTIEKVVEKRLSIGKNSEKKLMPLINNGYQYAGGLKSSTSSMLNYIRMYLENDDPVIIQSMNLLKGNMQNGRAYAWNTYNYNQDYKMLYHSGGTLGHSSWIALYPNQKTGLFMVTNIYTNDSQRDLNELSNKIIDRLKKLKKN